MNLFGFFQKIDINRKIADLGNRPGAVLLDVRSDEEFRKGHIPGAVNIPVEQIADVERVITDHELPVFIYCLRGTRSLRAAGAMKKLGYTNAESIGGIVSYKGELEK